MRLVVTLLVLFTFSLRGEEASLQTATGTLHGTLLVPVARNPQPVVLIIAGSGPTDRDGNSLLVPGANNSLKMLAEALANHGIASLRYDKRGVAASSGALASESDLRFDTYIDDAVEWGRKLRADARFSSVAIAGHSEGSLIGIVAAQRLPADGVVSLAGAGRPAGEVILAQLERNLSPSLFNVAREIVSALNAGMTYPNPPPELAALFRPSVQPYLISWFRYDPVQEISQLSVPVLVVQGTTDIQVPVDDARRLADANPRAKLLVIEGMNHVLKDVAPDPDAQTRSYSDPALPVNSTLVEAMSAFLRPGGRRRPVRSAAGSAAGPRAARPLAGIITSF